MLVRGGTLTSVFIKADGTDDLLSTDGCSAAKAKTCACPETAPPTPPPPSPGPSPVPPSPSPVTPSPAPTTTVVLETTMSQAADFGDLTIALTNVEGIKVGGALTLTDGANSDTSTVTAVTLKKGDRARRATSGTVTLADALTNSYSVGATVKIVNAAAGHSCGPSTLWDAPTMSCVMELHACLGMWKIFNGVRVDTSPATAVPEEGGRARRATSGTATLADSLTDGSDSFGAAAKMVQASAEHSCGPSTVWNAPTKSCVMELRACLGMWKIFS